MPRCLCRNGLGYSGTDQRTLKAGCHDGCRRDDRHGGSPCDRTAPPAVTGSTCRHQPESTPGVFADRYRRLRSRRRFRAGQLRRHRALSRICGAACRLSLGVYRSHFRHDGDRGGLLPGRRYLRGTRVSRPAPADDADDFFLGLRVPAVYRRIVLRQTRQRGIQALALGILLRRPRRTDCRTPVPAFDGARLGARRPARPPHHRGRLGPNWRKTDRSAQDPGRFGYRYPRCIR